MKVQAKLTKVNAVTISNDDNLWTVIRTYAKDENVHPQYTLINENAHRVLEGPYRTTKGGLKKMFDVDIEKLFEQD